MGGVIDYCDAFDDDYVSLKIQSTKIQCAFDLYSLLFFYFRIQYLNDCNCLKLVVLT